MTFAEVEAARGVTLTGDGLYPDRNVMHRNMGPPELFTCCSGRGWTYDGEGREKYCSCAAGAERSRIE